MQANDLPVVAQAVSPAVSPAYRISSHVLTVAALSRTPAPRALGVAAYGNWQDAVADVPAALDSFTVAETTDEAATWAAMGCV